MSPEFILKRISWMTSIPNWRVSDGSVQFGFEGIEKHEVNPSFVRQIHGIDIVQCNETCQFDSTCRPAADGIYTTEHDQVVGVQTADCLPVLVYQPDGEFVMAVHAGWRGLRSGILQKALAKAEEISHLDKVKVIIGPSIGQKAFEVGPEVLSEFQRHELGLVNVESWGAAKGVRDRWHLDLGSIAATICHAAGVAANHISVLKSCTYERDDLWHSYRRNGKKAGRNWSWIRIDREKGPR